MRFSATELADTVGGSVSGPEVVVDGIATDTRDLRAGQLFVPLSDRRDGHAFLAAAVGAGAGAYLTCGPTVPGATAITVDDTAAALRAIGLAARRRLPDRVAGITGSVGKTTVKDLLAGALSTTFHSAASPMSFNNEIGVPLTLANASEGVEAVVVEMGARGPGHIRSLCEIAEPTVGVVTRVGHAHIEQFGSIEGVAAAKGELVESLPSWGTAVLNTDDHRVLAMRDRARAGVVLYGISSSADVRAENVVLDEVARPAFRLLTPGGSAEVRLALHGRHQVSNALAAAAGALALGVPVGAVAEGLSAVAPPRWRMSIHPLGGGALLVNDTYNANPTSMRAALEALAAMEGRRRIAVLGEMAELGPSSVDDHRQIAASAAALGIEVIAFGTPSYGLPVVNGEEELRERLGPWRSGDLVLVKGSRAAGLELIVDALLRAPAA